MVRCHRCRDDRTPNRTRCRWDHAHRFFRRWQCVRNAPVATPRPTQRRHYDRPANRSDRARLSQDAAPPHGEMNRAGGFILVEILVALAILGMVLGYVYQTFSGAFLWLDQGARSATALHLAKS